MLEDQLEIALKRIKTLETALTPFAETVDLLDGMPDSVSIFNEPLIRVTMTLNVGHLRAAHVALKLGE